MQVKAEPATTYFHSCLTFHCKHICCSNTKPNIAVSRSKSPSLPKPALSKWWTPSPLLATGWPWFPHTDSLVVFGPNLANVRANVGKAAGREVQSCQFQPAYSVTPPSHTARSVLCSLAPQACRWLFLLNFTHKSTPAAFGSKEET